MNPIPSLSHPSERNRRQSSDDGFTLVEVMVVLVIIGLLATVVLINVMPSQDKAMSTKARADIATIEQAMEMYRLDNFTYPAGSGGLQALVTPPARVAAGSRPGGYLKRIPDDPWGRPYQLAVPGRSGPFDVYSLGADGSPGGEGADADVYSDS